MDKLAKKISDSELMVMQVLWEAKEALPLTEIRTRINRQNDWENSTIKTLLHRLHSKGAVAQEKREVFYYTPLISKEEFSQYSTKELINKLYAGNAKKMVASLLSSHQLGKDDIEELREMFKVEDND